MHDKDVFAEATRVEDWTPLAGTGAAARAKSAGLRRTRYAGIAGATAAVAVGVIAIAGTFGGGGAAAAGAGPAHPTPAHSAPAQPTPAVTTSQAPVKGTMGALFEQWKSCPDSELTAEPAAGDPSDLQQRWRDACHRDIATLSGLLPDYDVTPAVSSIGLPKDVPVKDMLGPEEFNDPSFVIPTGYTPHMGTALYRIVGKDGATSEVSIHALGRDDKNKPGTGAAVTLPNGLQAWLVLGTDLPAGGPGYEIYILSLGKTFYMFTKGQPDFDFKAVAMSPQFADMAAKALAAPEE